MIIRRALLKALVAAPIALAAASVAAPLVKGTRGAAPPPPAGSNAERIATALNGYTVPFAYNQPSDPVQSSTATVTPATLAVNIVAGRTLTLQAGAYGSPDWNVNDLDIICQAGVSFTGMNFNGSRIRITGASGGTAMVVAPTFNAVCTDIMIDNMSITMSAGNSLSPNNIDRVCFKNCTTRASGDSWGLIGGDANTDFLWLACDAEYSGVNTSRAPMRLVSVNRAVVVNNRFASNQAGARFHNTTTAGAMVNLAVDQNQLECGLFIEPNNGGGDGAGLVMGPVWTRNNNSYRPGVTQMYDFGTQTPANLQNATVTGNRGYGAASPGSAMTSISAGAGSTISDNLNQTYVSTPSTPQCGVQ